MKRILVRAGKHPLKVVSPEDTLERNLIGNNSGNLLFSHSVIKSLSVPGNELVAYGLDVDDRKAKKAKKEGFDRLVLPFANAFRPGFEGALRRYTRFIERLDLPTTVVGIGAQAGDKSTFDELAGIEGTARHFVRAVLKRSRSLGVRGEFTYEWVRSLGFSDDEVRVIGCPSLFMNGGELAIRKEDRPLSEDAVIATSVTPSVSGFGDAVGELYERSKSLWYVGQGIYDLKLLLWGEPRDKVAILDASPRHLSHPLMRDNRVRFFVDASTWIDFMRQVDFAFGTRFHGNVAALLAGTPAVIAVHDSRTRELAEYFDLPHHRWDPAGGRSLDPALLYAEADFGPFNRGHGSRFERYLRFLDENGLDHVFADGDGGASFEAAVAACPFPDPVAVLNADANPEVVHRLRWLKNTTAPRVASLESDVAQLRDRVRELERVVKAMERARPSPRPAKRAWWRRALGRARRMASGVRRGQPGLS